jgi:hypothetical protein
MHELFTPLTTLDYELYGLFAGLLVPDLDSAPGAQDVFNGALVGFDDAYNTLASLLLGEDAVIPATDLLGLGGISATGADGARYAALFGNFFDTGLSDLFGYFGAVWPG